MTQTMAEVRAQAKALGINSFGMSKAALQAAIASADRPEAAPSNPRAARDDSRAPTGRRARTPLGTPRQKLAYPKREGYVRRWFNDHRTRIHDATEAGYEHVREDEDGREVRVKRVVGVKEDGSPMVAYLMEIRREFYEEDQAAKQAPLDEFDAQLRRNLVSPQGADGRDQGRFYTPDEGSSLRTET